ncbi:hypothetical protein SBV1_30020 [Verrucomicrobia bacterium]|nr:hypothetical protein SBV1_30020 [Verrucomicrobiota bacterium]
MSELYFAPTKRAHPITLHDLQQRFVSAGLPCTIEEDSPDTHWLVFEPHECTIYASTKDGNVILATFNLGSADEPRVLTTVEQVMDGVGFSADDDADYA